MTYNVASGALNLTHSLTVTDKEIPSSRTSRHVITMHFGNGDMENRHNSHEVSRVRNTPSAAVLFVTHLVVLESGDVGLDGLFQVSGSHQSCGQVDVSVNEVRLQPHSMSVVRQRLG